MSNLYLHEALARDVAAGKRVHIVSFGSEAARANILGAAEMLCDNITVSKKNRIPEVTHASGGRLTGSTHRTPASLRGIEADRVVFHLTEAWTVNGKRKPHVYEDIYANAQAAVRTTGGDIINA